MPGPLVVLAIALALVQVGTNSPTNFAGVTGSVVLPAAVPSASPPLLALLTSALVGLGVLSLARRRAREAGSSERRSAQRAAGERSSAS